MNYWKMICTKWSRERLASFSSFKKTAYMILPLLVYFLVHDAAEVLLWVAVNQFMLVCKEETINFLSMHIYTVRGGINGLAILAGVASIWQAVKNEISGNDTEDKTHIEKKLTDYMLVAALAFSSALGFNVLFYLLGITESSQAFEDTANAQFGVVFFVGVILYGILSPFAEEAVFRGLIYNRMKRCFNFPIALIVSSLLFGCYHGNIVQAAYGTLAGILIAYTYEKYDCFGAAVLFHGVANISIYIMTCYNCFGSMERKVGIVVTAVSFIMAGICLWRIKK